MRANCRRCRLVLRVAHELAAHLKHAGCAGAIGERVVRTHGSSPAFMPRTIASAAATLWMLTSRLAMYFIMLPLPNSTEIALEPRHPRHHRARPFKGRGVAAAEDDEVLPGCLCAGAADRTVEHDLAAGGENVKGGGFPSRGSVEHSMTIVSRADAAATPVSPPTLTANASTDGSRNRIVRHFSATSRGEPAATPPMSRRRILAASAGS